MRQSRGFTVVEIVVVIALLAMVGGGVYVWQQKKIDAVVTTPETATRSASLAPSSTPQPTIDRYAGWKSYSTPLGLSFRYPAYLQLHEAGQSPTKFLTLGLTDPNYHEEFAGGVSVSVINNAAKESLRQYLMDQGMPASAATNPITVGGIVGLKTDQLPAVSQNNISVVVTKGTYIYRFDLVSGGGRNVSEEDFNALLLSVVLS